MVQGVGVGRGVGRGDPAHDQLRDLKLRMGGAAGQVLDRVAVAVTGEKVHLRIAVVGAQAGIHQAYLFHKFGPVEGGDGLHTGDDVAHRGIGGDLVRVFAVDDPVERLALGRQPLVQEIDGGCGAGVRVVQPL